MKKWTLLIAIMLLLSACTGSAESPTETPVEPIPAEVMDDSPVIAVPQDILGLWVLDAGQSTGGGSSMLDPLEAEFLEAAKIEITADYLIIGDFGHTYSWIDTTRIRINGVGVSFSSVNEGFFYVFTVQRDGDFLRLLTSDGTPFTVFGREGSAVAPAIEVAVVAPVAEAAPTVAACLRLGHLVKAAMKLTYSRAALLM